MDNDLIKKDIKEYLQVHENKTMLRFITCGSVDDGKSTLIGRLLHDSAQLLDDQLDSIKSSKDDEEFDFASLVDGLASEAEQGITIDVAYRYFATEKRKFIIADTPGHEQYTRNMATGASTADVAILLVDARYGVQTQTKRHSFIVNLLGIKNVIIAINKMDLVDFSEDVYEKIQNDYLNFAKDLNITNKIFIPISAKNGDNVVNISESTPWYNGKAILDTLEHIELSSKANDSFRFPVQYVNRPNLDFRGFCGTIASGEISVGDEVISLPSGKKSKVQSIVTYDGKLDTAYQDMAVTLTLEDEIDASRGDMIVSIDDIPIVSSHIEANIVWMSEIPLNLSNSYYIKKGSKLTNVNITNIEYKVDVNTLNHEDVTTLNLNEIGYAKLNILDPLVFDAYEDNRATGRFILIDKITNDTVGAGMIVKEDKSFKKSRYSAFELEMNALVRKYFPHWNAKDILDHDFSI